MYMWEKKLFACRDVNFVNWFEITRTQSGVQGNRSSLTCVSI